MGQSASKNVRSLPNATYSSDQGTLGSATGFILGTAAVTGTIFVHSIILTERSNAARTATLRMVESGGVDDATSDFLQAHPLAALEMVHLDFGTPGIVLNNGDALKGLASAATAVNYIINYSTER